MTKRILVGCEQSGIIRNAFSEVQWDSWSCDLLPSRSEGNHLEMDIFVAISDHGPWDIIILHPECTYLALSGNRHYGEKSLNHYKRLNQIFWVENLWEFACMNARIGVCLENPMGVLSHSKLGKPSQFIHPWEHGHGETKKTSLWLYNLPRITPSKIVDGREQKVWKMPPSKDRKRLRSETYAGWGRAMANQWGTL